MKIFIEKLYDRHGVLIRVEVIIESASGAYMVLSVFDEFDEKENMPAKYANDLSAVTGFEIVECKAVVKREA